MLAKAAAAYTDAVFIATAGSEFIEMYAGIELSVLEAFLKPGFGQKERQATSYYIY